MLLCGLLGRREEERADRIAREVRRKKEKKKSQQPFVSKTCLAGKGMEAEESEGKK